MKSKARRGRVMELWTGLPESWRTELMSAFHTFIPAFLGTLAVFMYSAFDTSWTKETLVAAVIGTVLAALRAGFKAASMAVLSRFLPDHK